jgi:hypothetical protein
MSEFLSRVGSEKDLGLSRGEYFQKLEDIDGINAELATLKGRETRSGIVLQELRFFRMPEFDFGNPSQLRDDWEQVKHELVQRSYPPKVRVTRTVDMVDPNFGKENTINLYTSRLRNRYPQLNWKAMGGYLFGMTANWQTSFPELPYNWMIVETLCPTDRLDEGLKKRKNLSYLEISDQLRSSKAELLQMLGFSAMESVNLEINIPTVPELVYLQSVCPETIKWTREWTSTQIQERNIFTKVAENNIIWNESIDSGSPEIFYDYQRDEKVGYRVLIKPYTGQINLS